MVIRPFDKSDALKLLPLVKSVPNASKQVELSVSFETSTGSTAHIEFKGDLEDATSLKDYLEAQLRVASESDAAVSYSLEFNPPLAVQGPSADGLIQRLTRLVSPAAHVVATATEES